MSDKTVSENIKSFAVKKAIDYVSGDPEKNIPKLINWADKFDKDNLFPAQRKKLHEIIDNPDNNWYRLILSLWSDIDDDVRKTMFENLAVNSFLIGMDKQHKIQDKYNCNVPWAILMDPTSACNLHCTGCWAAEYGNKLNMSYETLDDIINQGKEMGTYMYLFSGGEPLVRKKDIIRLCEAHPDCQFLAFTNGTLIDEEFADEMLRVKNFIPAISVEGFEEATDFRRGKGTFNAVMKAMEILKRKKLPFGASCCYTSQNVDSIGSEEFIDMLVDNGVKFAWFFHYMPVGNDAVTDLLPTPEQREKMYSQIRSFRETKPIFTIDFQNDGEFVGGCVAGGRLYMHINANGDIEPCAFIHYSDSNIKDKTLLEAYTSPLFMDYKNNQPFNENMFRPCPMLENPEYLEKMVAQSNAHSTDMQSPESAEHLCRKCKSYAENWIDTADKLWSMSPKCKNCSQKCSK
ncbi:radical SAM protein [Ruminococcus sp.]|uniref:radical SAM protein n=1 Tax=Ruminococcus sp. TaxID=41978 RepID=UPI0026113DED|nr:radical SAM protein [Ruminococcus sp.]MDD6988655.1 radical SAM protein [Ruminococcus sp.]MDY6201790.1 radical SAM protein [Ruminococcus sp.]